MYRRAFQYDNLKKPLSQSPRSRSLVSDLDNADSPKGKDNFQPLNVTCLEFDALGRYLAAADVGGRITVMNIDNWTTEHEFRSHVMQFDCLKSQQIDEKINVMRWLPPSSPSTTSLIVSNDRVIKLWKLGNTTGQHSLKCSYQNAHTCPISSLSLSSDRMCFASADDLRVEYWHFEHPERSVNVLDIKPQDMADLTEVITGVSFHATDAHILAISSSRGVVQLFDVRCFRNKKALTIFTTPKGEEPEELTDVLASVAECAMTERNGGSLITRDYMNIRSWDLRNTTAPTQTVPVHDYIRPYLGDLYENDVIFDKFTCRSFDQGTKVITGAYGSQFAVVDLVTEKVNLISTLEKPDASTALDFERKVGPVAVDPKGGSVFVAAVGHEVTMMEKAVVAK